jgi:anti-anti-sigma factor
MSKPSVISISVVDEIAYLMIRGRVVAGEEVDAVRETIVRAGPNLLLLVVNLRDVDKLDAAGLSALVFAYAYAQSLGARFRLAAVPPEIRQLLSITGLSVVFWMPDSAWPDGKTHEGPSIRRTSEIAHRGQSSWLLDRGESR